MFKSVAVPLFIAVLIGIGGAVASHESQISGIHAKLEAVHEDVKTIKDIILEKGLQ